MIGTMGALAGDRLVLGVGIGYLRGEFEVLGADYDARAATTEEFLRALREPPEGYSVIQAPARVPVWVGGNNRRAHRRAALLGDGWHPLWLPPDEYAAAREEILAIRRDAGLDGPFTFSFSAGPTRFSDVPDGGWPPAPARAPEGSEFRYSPEFWVAPDGRPRLVGSPDDLIGDLRLLAGRRRRPRHPALRHRRPRALRALRRRGAARLRLRRVVEKECSAVTFCGSPSPSEVHRDRPAADERRAPSGGAAPDPGAGLHRRPARADPRRDQARTVRGRRSPRTTSTPSRSSIATSIGVDARGDDGLTLDDIATAHFRGYLRQELGLVLPRARRLLLQQPRSSSWSRDYWGARVREADADAVQPLRTAPQRARAPHLDAVTFRGIRIENSPVWLQNVHGQVRAVHRPPREDGAGHHVVVPRRERHLHVLARRAARRSRSGSSTRCGTRASSCRTR